MNSFDDHLDFNPATCPKLQVVFDVAGTDRSRDYVDIQLDAPGRSAEEQRRLLNAVFLAFMTSRMVKLFVRDDLCLAGGRVATGIWVLD